MNKLPKILIADDSEFNRFYLEQVMNTLDYDYKIVSDGKDAVDEVKNGDYQLVIMDIEMPGMDGKEAACIIKKKLESPLNKIPIVALTAHLDKTMRDDIDKCGFDDVIIKPFDITEFKNILKTYVHPVNI